MNLFKRAMSLLIVLIAVMIAVSCTTEREAVDKSPELSLDKRLFEGEFFLRQTITRLPYTADYAFIGESNDGKIVKWKITENWLVAYSIWDKLNVVDTNESLDVNETPIVAYRIAGHYDIVPSENPTTGEALPVLSMNTDRPWNERRYILLADDSRSGVSNYELKYLRMTMEWGAPFYRAGLTNATDWEFYSHDGTFIAPKKYREYTAIADDKERYNKEVEWFQFYSTEYFEPINSWGNVYTMEDVEEFIGNEPAQVTYRYVFSKVNRDVVGRRVYDLETKEYAWKKGSKDNGFRPLEFQDELFREYGFFTNNFKGYDNYHGYKDDNYHILANYWNSAWADADKNWNFTCDADEEYNTCLEKLKYQQKVVYVSSPKMPLRMMPANCAITKDYNYSLLGARYAAMNPGSDVRKFQKWYVDNYKNDFFKTVKGSDGSDVVVRDMLWYTTDLNDPENPYSDWRDRCFIPEKHAWIQNWDGSFIDSEGEDVAAVVEQYKNDIVVLIDNPVEAYLPERDGNSLYGYGNYYNYSSTSRENAVKICVLEEEATQYTGEKAMVFETCYKNNDKMAELYVDEAGRSEWRGDRWDCQVFNESDSCPDGYVEAKAACVLNNERTCEVEDGKPVLRHRYDNGNAKAALLNWVDTPTEYGILGVSQWNVNPETGMSMGGGSNIAGSVLAWATTRAIDLARMVIDKDDPAAWDWEDLVNPDYANKPEVVWDNNPGTIALKNNKKSYNSMKMIKKDMPKLGAIGVDDSEVLKAITDEYLSKTQNHNRYNFSSVKGDNKWENEMVPYSIKKALFPWSDPANSPSYSDAEREIMEPWFSPAALEAKMIQWIDAKAMDFDFDESFLDGSIISFIKEKQEELRKEIPNWDDDGAGSEKYEKTLIYAIYNELEIIMYKGVAEHEMGHTMGLRHNFAGSTDINNYLDPYFASRNYPAMMDGVKELLETEQAKADYNPATFGRKAYRLKKEWETDINYYTYTSVMDYQREAYIHGVGLGKYDDAALKFVYGRSFEKVAVQDGDYGPLVVEGSTGDELGWVNPLRDPSQKDFVRTNETYINDDGTLKKVKVPTQVITYYENGDKVTALAPKAKMLLDGNLQFDTDSLQLEMDYDCDSDQLQCENDLTYLINDGRHYEYVFVSDEKSRDDPKANTFDGGYSGVDIIRQMKDMDDMFYYLRFFRRGNPRFREFRGRTSYKMILDTLFRKYKYIHFMLDFNFYAYDKWAPYLGVISSGGCPSTFRIATGTDYSSTKAVDNYICDEYQRAIRGEEYWIEGDKLRSITPMGPADHVLAGMEGVNYFYFDNIYKPAVGEYWRIKKAEMNEMDVDIDSKLEDDQNYYYQTTENYIDGIREIADMFSDIGEEDFIDIPGSMGRYQKDRYDIQDNPSIYYDKVIRRGFAEEKMVAMYAITNSGWFDSKYRRESRANSPDQMFDGLANVKFAMLADISNEEALFSFSPYCVDTDSGKVVQVDYPINLLTNYAAEPPLIKSDLGSAAYEPKKNLCSQVGDTPGRYAPIHAGWTYFDKMWPNYWAMGNVMNTSADTSVLMRFVSYKIPATEHHLYLAPDVNETEFLNKDGNSYYRAQLPNTVLDSLDSGSLAKWKACKKDRLDNDQEFETCIDEITFPSWYANQIGEPEIAETSRFDNSDEFRKFLADKYAKYSPAFRLVQSAGVLKDSEDADMESGAEGYTRLVIMETTLDQLNTFAADQLGFAAIYASRY